MLKFVPIIYRMVFGMHSDFCSGKHRGRNGRIGLRRIGRNCKVMIVIAPLILEEKKKKGRMVIVLLVLDN